MGPQCPKDHLCQGGITPQKSHSINVNTNTGVIGAVLHQSHNLKFMTLSVTWGNIFFCFLSYSDWGLNEEHPPGEPLARAPTLLPRPCPRVPCCDPVSEEVDPECEWLLSFRLPEDLWYQHRSSSETAVLPPAPPPPSLPNDGVRTIWERDGVSLPLPSPPSSPPQASLYSPPAV